MTFEKRSAKCINKIESVAHLLLRRKKCCYIRIARSLSQPHFMDCVNKSGDFWLKIEFSNCMATLYVCVRYISTTPLNLQYNNAQIHSIDWILQCVFVRETCSKSSVHKIIIKCTKLQTYTKIFYKLTSICLFKVKVYLLLVLQGVWVCRSHLLISNSINF